MKKLSPVQPLFKQKAFSFGPLEKPEVEEYQTFRHNKQEIIQIMIKGPETAVINIRNIS
ncbi:MAG: hypothetical protein PHW04_03575 [Candidatus Wallbacteria bacterium]|nr:hypothetical protein [Candidatus Wallbacteria bacterium]